MSGVADRGNREGHGWGAYFWPLVSFLLLVELGRRLPEGTDTYLLPIKVAVPGGLLVYYFARGHYPELRRYPFGVTGAVLDFAVGVAGAALWMAPYLLFESWRPEEPGFDAHQWGASLAPLVLFIRGLGYGIVTPFAEELLVRSWLIRYIDVFDRTGDFRDAPIGHYTLRSFIVVVVFFTFSHMPWEWPVAVAWVVATTLWLYYRKHLMSLVIVHAGSNLAILVFVILMNGSWTDADGNPLSLWFFV